MDDSEKIVIKVIRAKCGHNIKLKHYEIWEAPPYVMFHVEGDTVEELLQNLMTCGHSFEVKVETEEVSLIELIGLTSPQG